MDNYTNAAALLLILGITAIVDYSRDNDVVGAGIGGGSGASSGSITINGGTVNATGGYSGAAIGSGKRGSLDSITINGGAVTATNVLNTNGIGAGANGASTTVTLNWTEDTKDTMSVISYRGYSGTVKLDRPFEDKSSGTVFYRTANADKSKLSGKTLTPFTKLFSERDRYVSFDPLSEERAQNMVAMLCARRRVRLDRPEAYALVEMVGTDAYRLENEVSKLCDYVGDGGTITRDVLKFIVTPSVEYEIFPMLNALLAGNKKTAMRMLTEAMADGQENPLRVASFLEGRLRQMLIGKELLEEKRPRPEILKTMGGNPKAAEIALKNAQKFPLGKLRSAVAAFAEINARLKMGETNETDALILAIYKSF